MDPTRLPQVPHSLAPGSQTVCYLPWLKVSASRGLLAEQSPIRRAG
jgi:hypothetical protein